VFVQTSPHKEEIEEGVLSPEVETEIRFGVERLHRLLQVRSRTIPVRNK